MDWLRRLLAWIWKTPDARTSSGPSAQANEQPFEKPRRRARPRRVRPRYHPPAPLRWRARRAARPRPDLPRVSGRPYAYAFAQWGQGYLDLGTDVQPERLSKWGLPVLGTPQDLANWLDIPLGRLAWLTHRFQPGFRALTEAGSHYHHVWVPKRGTGYRLLEIPKPSLKRVQQRILRGILDRVPAHPAAHGFVAGRSIGTNAAPHVGQTVLVKLDLENFYATVHFSRVVSVFRGLGYSREVALWLARLTTSRLPEEFPGRSRHSLAYLPYARRHLPQGAPTSPALANLCAFGLDVRLAGAAARFHAAYTRYGDDLTFSGGADLHRALRLFVPLTHWIIRQERFWLNRQKLRVVGRGARQVVTGVIVNDRLGISRREFDRLKATLTNCIRQGPASQNRDNLPHFAQHLRGRIAHLQQLHPERGARLLELYQQIHWG